MRNVAAVLSLAVPWLTMACSSTLEVTRVFPPEQAAIAQGGGKLRPVAVERSGSTLEIPSAARVEGDRVYWPNEPGVQTRALLPGDVIQKDSEGRIVAVRSSDSEPIVTRFVPGSATSPVGVSEVRGTLLDPATIIPLKPTDRVRMTGTFESDEPIPGGGHVKTTRSTGFLVAGLTLFTLSYAPSVYVGATSSSRSDKDLYIPVAGPWVDLASRAKCVPPPGSQNAPISPCLAETLAKVALVTGGAVQALSAIFIGVGIPSTTRVSYEGDRLGRLEVRVAPTYGAAGNGVRAYGTF